MKTTPLVLIDVQTDQGIIGRSYVRCYTPVALRAFAQLFTDIEPLIAGRRVAPLTLEQHLQRAFRLLGTQGLTGAAMAGIDMALWDALAKAAEVPLVTLLGGEPKSIPAYASLRSMGANAAAAEAEEVLAMGFAAVKVKVGRFDLAADLEVIRAIRSVAGPNVRIMVDFNQSLSVPEAIARGRVLDDENIYWIEEPAASHDFAGHARVAAAVETPIQLGENWSGLDDMAKSVAAHASDHVMLDAMKIGGVTGWMRAAALARASNLPASSHTFPEFSAHLLGVTPTSEYLEYLDHVGPILQQPVQHKNGQVLIPNSPGAGIDWEEKAIERAR